MASFAFAWSIESSPRTPPTTTHATHRLLFLGEGDMSLSAGLCGSGLIDTTQCHVTATTYDTDEQLHERHPDAAGHVATLNSLGCTTEHGVDATALESTLTDKLAYDEVVFAFPHCGGKSPISRNRALLKGFFESVHCVTHGDSLLCVPLARGQGGTTFDVQRPRKADHWQIMDCGAEFGWHLVGVIPFPQGRVSTYHSSGYRGQDKGFATDHGLVHFFQRDHPSIPRFSPSNSWPASKEITNTAIADTTAETIARVEPRSLPPLLHLVHSAVSEALLHCSEADPCSVDEVKRELGSVTYVLSHTTAIYPNRFPLAHAVQVSKCVKDEFLQRLSATLAKQFDGSCRTCMFALLTAEPTPPDELTSPVLPKGMNGVEVSSEQYASQKASINGLCLDGRFMYRAETAQCTACYKSNDSQAYEIGKECCDDECPSLHQTWLVLDEVFRCIHTTDINPSLSWSFDPLTITRAMETIIKSCTCGAPSVAASTQEQHLLPQDLHVSPWAGTVDRLQFVHDVSFWIPTTDFSKDECCFSPSVQHRWLTRVTQEALSVSCGSVKSVNCMDAFVHPRSGKQSVGFRIVYTRYDGALCRETATKWQLEVRERLAAHYGADFK
eukprot:m.3884 g.3884  ORF g.3884 m.3884 type:complete len:612 (-) comp4338_c0_seq1:90-1925(-)